jgi:hypothetical protein
MAVRLQMKLGVVPDADRVDDSPDTLVVVEPNVGSVARSKGNLYLLVTGRVPGGRVREATRLAADTIRSEYYYDESAGIRVCLEKAIRLANKRLAHVADRLPSGGQEGSGPIGVGVAVVRANELYVATVGPAEAYLIRGARLSTLPDPHRDRGLPTGELEPDVWRGELAVGDSLVLISPNVMGRLGPDELKDAMVTLHPQSAIDHLHHQFVATDGSGSDGAIALEATEVALTTKQRTLVPVRPPEPLAGAPDRSPIPLADSVTDGVAAARDSARAARTKANNAFEGGIRRLQDLLPRRSPARHRVTPLSARRESQRRAAIALLVFLLLAATLGLGVSLWAPPTNIGRLDSLTAAQRALAAAQDDINRVFGPGVNIMDADPDAATRLLADAYQQLKAAGGAGAGESVLGPLRQQVLAGLDTLYKVKPVGSQILFSFAGAKNPVDLRALVRGPDGAPYVLDKTSKSVLRIDLAAKKATTVLKAGQSGAAEPRLLATGGRDLLILDSKNTLWRWRPADSHGRGTLRSVRVRNSSSWGTDVRAIGTFIRDPQAGLYNLYVVDPSEEQVLTYAPAIDGSGYPALPTRRLPTNQKVDDVTAMYIDSNIFLAQGGAIRRVVPTSDWRMAAPGSRKIDGPGDDVVRPAPRYTLITGTGDPASGTLYLYDPNSARIVAMEEPGPTSEFVQQYRLANGDPGWKDLRGIYYVPGTGGAPPSIVWIDANRVGMSVLQAVPEGPSASPSPSPRTSPSANPSRKPRATPKP